MDNAVIQYYRRLLKEDFPYAGEIEQPTVFVEAIGEKLIHCGNTGNYMQLYLHVADDRVVAIRYLCSCEPAANVAVEILCGMTQGKSLSEATALTEEPFYQLVGSRVEEFAKKVRGILSLLNEGIAHYRGADSGEIGSHLTWDRSYNP
ncbi:MAG: hypothetical protein FWE89_02075 [Syntrophaceae bacterium]|nr:hypothetical protein [Syntrophaceae bacterium]